MQHTLRSRIEAAWHAALHDLDPANVVREHIQHHLQCTHATVIAIGKAAPAMASGALDALGPATDALIITTDHTDIACVPDGVTVMRASHPVPDFRSIAAAEAALALARSLKHGPLVVLVSGGASSLLCAPHAVSFEEKRAITDQLLRSNAGIQACNTVRRHISAIKGGGLSSACSGPVHCIILSDVVGGDAHDIGSGPAVPDPTTVDDALRVISAHLENPLRSRCANALRETLKPNDANAARITSAILASPIDLARVFSIRLREQGWDTCHEQLVDVTAEQLSCALVRSANAMQPGQCSVFACEPTLHVPQKAGRGGRAGWVALHALRSLPDDVLLWAAASDGVDGTSGTAGACIIGHDKHRLDPLLIDAHLCRMDDTALHTQLGSSLPGIPTGSNYTDVYAVLRTAARDQ